MIPEIPYMYLLSHADVAIAADTSWNSPEYTMNMYATFEYCLFNVYWVGADNFYGGAEWYVSETPYNHIWK